jgi:SAM-dependent methyltransferase
LENSGHCLTCNQTVTFSAKNDWLRDNYLCTNCGSIPRERALMYAIQKFYPQWQDLIIHESSPGSRGASVRLQKECRNYIPSQYFPDRQPGSNYRGIRCENLEKLTFEDESVDLHITQDVMEHVFHSSIAFREIARTLKPGGAHIFTVPLVNKEKPSRLRAKMLPDGSIEHIQAPLYHGNPISLEGTLVTIDWGYDITRFIFDSSGLFTQMLFIDDISKGIRAEYIEVLITIKDASGMNIIYE